MNNIDSLKKELLDSRRRNEYAEVVLSNLLRLTVNKKQKFKIPFDDVVVSIAAAIKILEDSDTGNIGI